MRSALRPLTLLRPRTLREALIMMQAEPAVPIAGCTDVYVQLQFGQAPGTRYIDLWPLHELRGIAIEDGRLWLGALTTYTELIRSRAVNEWCPMLVAAAHEIGGVQIQNRGTIGGNVANGSPAGDTLPVLAAADADVVLVSARGTRRVAFTEYYTGYRQSVLQPDELIVRIELPRIEGRQWFRKVGTRAAQAISKVVMAAVRAPAPRIALGSVAPTVIRLRKAEAALAHGDLARAGATLEQEIAPIDDLRSTAEYRQRVTANLLARFWHDTGSA